MKKKIGLFFLALILAVGLFAVPAQAAESNIPTDEAGNKIYSEMFFHYTIDQGSVVIKDFFASKAQDREKVVVPMMIANTPVNYIAPYAFEGTGIKELWLPNILMMTEGVLMNGQYIDATTKVVFYKKDANGNLVETDLPYGKDNHKVPTDEPTVAPTSKTSGDFTYTDYGSYAVITGYNGKDLTVTVPPTIGAIPVKTVQGNAFAFKLYDEVRIPSGVEVDGQINAKKTVLNYDVPGKEVVFERKEYETDAAGNTYHIEDVIEIDDEQMTTVPTADPDETTTEEAAASGETDEEGNVVGTNEEKSSLWIWIVSAIGGAAVLAGAVIVIKTMRQSKENR